MTALDFTARALSIGGLAVESLCAISFALARKVGSLPFVFFFLIYMSLSYAMLLIIAETRDVWPALVFTTYIGYFFEAAAVWELVCHLLKTSAAVRDSHKVRIAVLFILCGVVTLLMTNLHSFEYLGVNEQQFLHI